MPSHVLSAPILLQIYARTSLFEVICAHQRRQILIFINFEFVQIDKIGKYGWSMFNAQSTS